MATKRKKEPGGSGRKLKVTQRRRKNVTLGGVRYDEISAQSRAKRPVRPGFNLVMPKQYRVGPNSWSWKPPKKRAVHKR